MPLLVSMPHAGLKLTPAVAAVLADEARSLPDTDWHIARLYDFAAELGASTCLRASYRISIWVLLRVELCSGVGSGA